MEGYIVWELIGGGFPRYLNTSSNLFIVAVHYTHKYMMCTVATVDSTHLHHVVHYNYQNTPYLVAIFDCIHAGQL